MRTPLAEQSLYTLQRRRHRRTVLIHVSAGSGLGFIAAGLTVAHQAHLGFNAALSLLACVMACVAVETWAFVTSTRARREIQRRMAVDSGSR